MENSINWGDVATWFTGIVTLGLFIVGFLQIRNERAARIKNEKELELRAVREQAEKISAWIARDQQGKISIAVLNNSQQPVYQVIITETLVGQTGELGTASQDHALLSIVPPGLGYVTIDGTYYGMHRRPGVEIAFSDVTSRNWIRKSNGELIGIDMSTVSYYEINLPATWNDLEPNLPSM
jgi:hypothetical protein